jgi:L-2-hydroxyglutarate oxidase
MTKSSEVIVVGAGIVGLATAYSLLEKSKATKVTIIDKESNVAQHQSSHNSGVIHSGLYYKPGSLKARNCIEGYKALLDFCDKYKVPYEITGKIVVANSLAEARELEKLYEKGSANGLKGLKRLSASEIIGYEPHCSGTAGIYVPQTGIIDYLAVAQKLAEVILALGGEIILNEEIVNIEKKLKKIKTSSKLVTWESDFVIVCGGLQSDRLLKNTEKDPDFRILPFRGEYYKFKDSAPKLVKNLIYPVPNPAFPFLGVHFTRGIDGVIECGPNAIFSFSRENYDKKTLNLRDTYDSLTWPGTFKLMKKHWRLGILEQVRSVSKKAFVRELQKLVPEVEERHLEPAVSGIRAQASNSEGFLIDDFKISRSGNVMHVCNAPSPAATASLAIGASIASEVFK